MFGRIDGLHSAILFISLFASFTDLIWRRIFNWFTLPCALLGLIFSAYSEGGWGVQQSLLGFFAAFLLYGWMFWLRFIGGGDVKLLMVFGAWGGARYAIEVAILGVLVGGVFAFLILMVRGQIFGFLRKLSRFLLSLAVPELEVEFPKLDKSLTFPFGIPIAIAAVWNIFLHPLESIGISLWN